MKGPVANGAPEPTDAQSTHEQRIHVGNGAPHGAIGANPRVG